MHGSDPCILSWVSGENGTLELVRVSISSIDLECARWGDKMGAAGSIGADADRVNPARGFVQLIALGD